MAALNWDTIEGEIWDWVAASFGAEIQASSLRWERQGTPEPDGLPFATLTWGPRNLVWGDAQLDEQDWSDVETDDVVRHVHRRGHVLVLSVRGTPYGSGHADVPMAAFLNAQGSYAIAARLATATFGVLRCEPPVSVSETVGTEERSVSQTRILVYTVETTDEAADWGESVEVETTVTED